jgi:ribosomal protein S18 acetylase RimI-like enzyme
MSEAPEGPSAEPESPTGSVVRMTDADVESVAPLLVRAFDHDPLFEWIEPRPEPRAAFVRAFMRALAWRSHLFAEALRTAPELEGVSLWKGPELGRLSPEQLERCGLDRVGDLLDPDARARFEAADVEDVLEREVPRPRWYLGVLGVDPDRQSQGWGRRLMKPILDRADAAGLPVSLETMREANVAYYRRHGFQVAAAFALAGGGPTCWVMRRPPQA